ncbi:putative toxin-antitoxin system toxin component, PIN family [Thermotoga sp. SG1]|uniref:putative toxin-antitoxin system toxin component, PIN family n=1 Tax=Thermotoga sp. SG1 TaxID=126739 RepID=UPI000C75D9BB|nr:putative toxin-antitoxin system toxin component, PIN family [Thermotoga sp. SG1]PLV56748.1 twitching motility protein PilT [Thermotoga sp. SG1]
MKVVVDANVLVSGIINPYGKPAHILNLVLDEKLILCIDSRIYSEYERVLLSPKFSFPREHVRTLLDFVKRKSVFVIPSPLGVDPLDEFDLPFLEVAFSAKVPIVTGNKKHFENVKGIEIYTPSEFIEKFIRHTL